MYPFHRAGRRGSRGPPFVWHDARLEGQDVRDAVHRKLVGVAAVDPLLRGHLVARHQRSLRGDDRDVLHLERRGLEGHIDRDRLAALHADVRHLGGLVPDERGPDVHRASGHVVHKVVAVGVRLRPEAGADDDHLGIGNWRALLVAHSAFDLTSRRLRQERARSRRQRDCRERERPRHASEGAHTALLHGNILQRCEQMRTAQPNDRMHARPSWRPRRRAGECDCGDVGMPTRAGLRWRCR
jgi:hypothetical protein